MGELHLFRHGQGSFGGPTYDRLSDKGVRQAHLLGGWLRQNGVTFDAVFTGTLARQQQTAAGARAECGGPEPRIDFAFDEHDTASILRAVLPPLAAIDPALAADATRLKTDLASFQRAFERGMNAWADRAAVPDGVETPDAFRRRVSEGLDRAMAAGRRVAVFTSGGVIAAAVARALSLPDREMVRLTCMVRNGSGTIFLFDQTRFSLLVFNQTPHLEQAGDPGLLSWR